MKKYKPSMKLFSCEKWTTKKCKSPQPCQMITPPNSTKVQGCVLNKKSKWVIVPTSALAV
jgi:hypothetical protein